MRNRFSAQLKILQISLGGILEEFFMKSKIQPLLFEGNLLFAHRW